MGKQHLAPRERPFVQSKLPAYVAAQADVLACDVTHRLRRPIAALLLESQGVYGELYRDGIRQKRGVDLKLTLISV